MVVDCGAVTAAMLMTVVETYLCQDDAPRFFKPAIVLGPVKTKPSRARKCAVLTGPARVG